MRMFLSGPRLFGFIRPGVSFGVPNRQRSPQLSSAADRVYVIEGAPGHVKIGFSRDPRSRLATLQTGSPFPLSLVFNMPSPRAYDIEQEAHAILASQRTEGEWFLADKELAIAAIFGAASRLHVTLRPASSMSSSAVGMGWAIGTLTTIILMALGVFAFGAMFFGALVGIVTKTVLRVKARNAALLQAQGAFDV